MADEGLCGCRGGQEPGAALSFPQTRDVITTEAAGSLIDSITAQESETQGGNEVCLQSKEALQGC